MTKGPAFDRALMRAAQLAIQVWAVFIGGLRVLGDLDVEQTRRAWLLKLGPSRNVWSAANSFSGVATICTGAISPALGFPDYECSGLSCTET